MTELIDLNSNSTDSEIEVDNITNLNNSFGHADPSVAVGLSDISYYSSEEPFINLLKHAGGIGGFDLDTSGIHSRDANNTTSLDLPFLLRGDQMNPSYLNPDGTINSLPDQHDRLAFLLYNHAQPAETVSGTYVFLYEGTADISFRSNSSEVIGTVISDEPGKFIFEIDIDEVPGSNSVYEVVAEFPGEPGSSEFDAALASFKPIGLVREENIELFEAGAIFNPEFLALFKDYHTLRFMDWMETNFSTVTNISDIAKTENLTYAIPSELTHNFYDLSYVTTDGSADGIVGGTYVTEIRNRQSELDEGSAEFIRLESLISDLETAASDGLNQNIALNPNAGITRSDYRIIVDDETLEPIRNGNGEPTIGFQNGVAITQGHDLLTTSDVIPKFYRINEQGNFVGTDEPGPNSIPLQTIATGVPLEVMVALTNQVGADPWFNIPHGASDEFVVEFASFVRDNLDEGLIAKFEYSNEIWNFQFTQTQFALRQAFDLDPSGTTNANGFHGYRAAQIADIINGVFADRDVENVLATQTVSSGVTKAILSGVELYLDETSDVNEVNELFSSLAVVGYFGQDIEEAHYQSYFNLINVANQQANPQQFFNDELANFVRFGSDVLPVTPGVNNGQSFFPSSAFDTQFQTSNFDLTQYRIDIAAQFELAQSNGLDFIQYEGGFHSVIRERFPDAPLVELGEFFEDFHASANLGELQAEAIDIFIEEGGTLVNDFAGVGNRNHFFNNNFGTRNHLFDDNPQAAAFEQHNLDTSDASINSGRDLSAFQHGLTVLGTDGNDTIIGSSQEDFLTGSGGNDSLASGDDDDGLHGGTGNDTIDAGRGDDTAIGGGGIDLIIGGLGNDLIEGNTGNDVLSGQTGNDTIDGGSGNDAIFSGADNDILYGGQGDDRLDTGIGNDSAFGQGGRDTLNGEDGHDALDGGSGFDTLLGGNGDDTLNGGSNADNLFGDSGNDLLNGDVGVDRLFGGSGDDVLNGGISGDVLSGDSGRDIVNGEDGNDRLFGGSGFDTLNGGSGDDTLNGGFNADTFVFEDGFGNDTIIDFEQPNNFERIDLSALTAVSSFADLFIANNADGDAVITIGSNTITLNGVDATSLIAGDFIF